MRSSWEQKVTAETFDTIIERIREVHAESIETGGNRKDYYIAVGHLVTEEIYNLDGEDLQL